MDIKGKINFFEKDELIQLAPELDINNFSDIGEWYDVLEETLLDQGFVLYDDEIDFIKEWKNGRYYFFKYNCAIVQTIKSGDKYSIKKIGIAYHHIKNNKMTDLEKIIHARNHLSAFKDANGLPNEDSVKAFAYLDEYIKKFKEYGYKNIKQLLK